MSIPAAWPQVLDFFGTPLVIESSPGQLSSDPGLLPVHPFDQRIGFSRSFADALDDPPRSRAYGAPLPGDGAVPVPRHPGRPSRWEKIRTGPVLFPSAAPIQGIGIDNLR